MDQLCKNVQNETWHDVYKTNDTQEAYNLFYNKLYNISQNIIPLKRYKNNERGKIPWITKGILISRKTKNKLYKSF